VESPKCVVCSHFHHRGVFVWLWGSLYGLNQVGLEEMDGRAAIHMAGWPFLPGSADFQHWIPLVNQHSNVTVMSRAELTQRLVGRPLSPLGLGSGLTWSMCHIHPCGVDDFVIWSTLLYHPLKCSNLVPKFLKSNKH
jgi:hypothetical protein